MGIIRFLAIAVLAYLGYRTLQKIMKKSGSNNLFAKQQQEIKNSSDTDILEEDPVCGKLVPRHQAVIWQNNNQTHYFCSGECCATFQKREKGEKQ